MAEYTAEMIGKAVTQALQSLSQQDSEPELEAEDHPTDEVAPPVTPPEEPQDEAPAAPTDAEVELQRMKALMSAYIPADLDVEEELKAVYGNAEEGFGYRKPEVTPPTTQTGRRIEAPSAESAPKNGTQVRKAGQPGYITIAS